MAIPGDEQDGSVPDNPSPVTDEELGRQYRERQRFVDQIVEQVYGSRFYMRDDVRRIIDAYERLKNKEKNGTN